MWSLYEQEKRLPPLVFSNNKSQEDIVNEILDEIKKARKVIFIRGMCGTGKSAIALHLAKELGKACIIVPSKNLQKQYEEDYTEKKSILKNNGEKLKIKVITGRRNHKCPFSEENKRKSSQTSLAKFENIFDEVKEDLSADAKDIPCKIELRERNREKIMEYINKNKNQKNKDFMFMKDIRRSQIASVCPYWSPLIPVSMDLKIDSRGKEKYSGIDTDYIIHLRTPGCSYYEQFLSYKDSDVIVFNSHKYKIEMSMGRKPKTEIDVIDECDEFLDSFSNEEEINLNRLQFALDSLNLKRSAETMQICNQIKKLVKELNFESFSKTSIEKIKDTKTEELLELFRKDSDFLSEVFEDEDNYCFRVYEIAKTFENFQDETYVSFKRNKENTYINLVTTNLDKKFAELREKNKILVLMSGTIHSPDVLKDIFGIEDFSVIEAENQHQGQITNLKTGMEIDCKFENFKNKRVTRETYLRAFSKCISVAPKPILVHVTSFYDLPTEKEKQEFNIINLISREELKKLQDESEQGELIREFKQGKNDILFSTRCNRGVDFPGETCNSIIITKFPYPDAKSLFWEVLKKNFPEKYWEFYKDKARRELLQRIYRGLRSKQDHIYLLSPDIRVFLAEID